MADLLYGCVGVDGRRKRKQREFRSIGFTIDGYTDEELRARYRFGKESIEYITGAICFFVYMGVHVKENKKETKV